MAATNHTRGTSTCAEDGCGASHYGRGYCSAHYFRRLRAGTLPPKPERQTTCKHPGCKKPIKARGICGMHYYRLRKHGSLLLPKKETTTEMMHRLTEKTEDCWLWKGAILKGGYGKVTVGKKTLLAHRVAYGILRGPIPDGLHIDHLCRVRNCVNPQHLEAVTPFVNYIRGESTFSKNARKTHCINGHEFTPENTFLHKGKKPGTRNCRECARARNRLRLRKSRAAMKLVPAQP